MSRIFKSDNRTRYYELLQVIRDTGDWEAWLAFFLTGVSEVSAQASDTARRILVLREAQPNVDRRAAGARRRKWSSRS